MYQEIRNVHFLGNLECFVSLLTCVLRFASLPYHQRIVMKNVGFIYSAVKLVGCSMYVVLLTDFDKVK